MRTQFSIVFLFLASPALSEWTTEKGENSVTTVFSDPRYDVSIACKRNDGFEFSIADKELLGDTFQNVERMNMVFTFSDGSSDLWSFATFQEGNALTSNLLVVDPDLDIFRKGSRFKITVPATEQVVLEGDMKGTSDARAAFKAHCGL